MVAPESTATTVEEAVDGPDRAALWGLAGALVLMVLAMAIPAAFDWYVHIHSFPPLHAEWEPRVGVGTVLLPFIAVLVLRYADRVARSLRWGPLLIVVIVTGFAWMLALVLVDGLGELSTIMEHQYEYLQTARNATNDLPAFFEQYVSRIRLHSPGGHLAVHVAGHPAGALTFFVMLVRLGLGSGLVAGLIVTGLAATTAAGVMVTMRALDAEQLARRAAPFLTIGPAALWQAVSGDAMFAAVAAWGLAALALACRARGRRREWVWAVVAGLLLGYCVMLSYGLPLLGVLAIAVLWLGRSWRPLVPAIVAAFGVVLAFGAFGFWWWEAFPVLQARYWEGVAGRRPPQYWMWANLAALAFSAGPAAFAGLAVLLTRGRSLVTTPATRVAAVLASAGWTIILIADLSQMSRAEVERIWLPFVPWLLIGCALLPPRARKIAFLVQVLLAVLVQHLLRTSW